MSSVPTLDELEAGIRSGDRVLLAQAITLVESRRDADRDKGRELLAHLANDGKTAHRVGISGVPGVGKSTLIEALGLRLVERGHRVAVLAVDPSSTLSGGSILGDKSRMNDLARSEQAFIRPSPSAATLGGVARRTREAMQLCEAAGFDVVLIETVGVGQSETSVADMVDIFVVLTLPGAGDELQGIKKGILERADIIAVNKADGERVDWAQASVADHEAALHYARSRSDHWTPQARAVSAQTGAGLDELWEAVLDHHRCLQDAGALDEKRREQRARWMWNTVEERLLDAFRFHPGVAEHLAAAEASVRSGERTPEEAAENLLALFLRESAGSGKPETS